MQTILLNPFSVSLDKYPFIKLPEDTKPVFSKGDYRIYKWSHEHYLHTFKNIIFGQRCAPNTDLIDNLINNTIPTDEGKKYHDYERPLSAIREGMEAAKSLNFTVK